MIDKTIYEKLANYCAYQERCVVDVKQKLQKLKVDKEEFNAYINKLKTANFLNEDRYVKYFVAARTKKKWGKAKIKSALGVKRIDSSIVQKYLDDIDVENYEEQMRLAAEKKWKTIKGETLRERKTKLMRFLLSKGYEMDRIVKAIKAFE